MNCGFPEKHLLGLTQGGVQAQVERAQASFNGGDWKAMCSVVFHAVDTSFFITVASLFTRLSVNKIRVNLLIFKIVIS